MVVAVVAVVGVVGVAAVVVVAAAVAAVAAAAGGEEIRTMTVVDMTATTDMRSTTIGIGEW